MSDITVKFVDFWNGFNCHDNFLLNALRHKHNVTVLSQESNEIPKILFCSAFGIEHLKHSHCIKIYFTGENDVPDFNFYDYAISFHQIDFAGRHLRYPLYATYEAYSKINDATQLSDAKLLNRGFCSVVISNIHTSNPTREAIWEQLNNYKTVTSGGRYKNNIGAPVLDKIEFIKNYKFNLALENSKVDHYTTEKIVEPFAAFSVPIYWGNKLVDKEFNKDAFINISDFDTIDKAIDYIAYIDNNEEAYLKMLHAPRLSTGNNIDWSEKLSDFLCTIVSRCEKRVPYYGFTWSIRERQRIKEYLHNLKILRGFARRYLNWQDK